MKDQQPHTCPHCDQEIEGGVIGAIQHTCKAMPELPSQEELLAFLKECKTEFPSLPFASEKNMEAFHEAFKRQAGLSAIDGAATHFMGTESLDVGIQKPDADRRFEEIIEDAGMRAALQRMEAEEERPRHGSSSMMFFLFLTLLSIVISLLIKS